MASSNDTSKFAVKQLQGEIKGLFGEDLIDLSDLEGTRINKELAFLSRGFAAYTLYCLAGISESEAAEAVVDGTRDNGIDAVYWHQNNNILWLVQSKWIQKGTGQPEYAGINTFATGVRNLIEDNLDNPNPRLIQQKEEAEHALETMGVRVKLVICHTGQGISKVSRKCLDDLVSDLNTNENDEIFSYQVFDKDQAYQIAVENANKLNIEVEINLSNWGKMDDPYTAFYGTVSALDLAELWVQHKNNLFAHNLRHFMGKTKANDHIAQTLREEPTSFWYFNNGVTALCQELKRKGKGTKRLNDDFWCKGISIINGAQTVGSIGRFYEENPDESRENLEQVELLIKLICLDECSDENFGVKVTRASNTQNHVENRDFLALDPIQRKIARELKAWDNSKSYLYKRSDEIISSENSCTLTEVTKALASKDSVELTATIQKDISEIWSDTSNSLYKRIFNPSISPVHLWRAVEVYRIVKANLEERSHRIKDTKLISKIMKYGDLFILHLVFQSIEAEKIKLYSDDFQFKDYDLFLPRILETNLEKTKNKLSNLSSKTRFGAFFKNDKKCSSLKQEILEA